MKVFKLIARIAIVILAFIVFVSLYNLAMHKRTWVDDEPPAIVSLFGDKAKKYINDTFSNIYGEGGDGSEVSGQAYDEAAEYAVDSANGIYNDAVGLLQEGTEKIKQFFPNLTISLPDVGSITKEAPADAMDMATEQMPSSGITVDFIDVGQADCILIYADGEAMLIDAGNNNDGPLVVDYIQSLGISHLDYVIGTHAHEDHIGGLDDVIDAFDVSNIMLPVVDSDTKTYMSVLSKAQHSSAQVLSPAVGDSYSLGRAAFSVMSCDPVEDETNLNESSIVIKMTYDSASFLFTGDAEKANERTMLDEGLDLDCDVLKVGHHGSYTSSDEDFLAAVSPAIAVISCGQDNEYGHPHDVTMDALDETGAAIFRTDLSGTVRVHSNGMSYDVDTFTTNTDGGAD